MGEFSLDAVLNLPEHKLVSAETAENFDSLDKLSRFRDEFVIPTRREVGAKESDITGNLDETCTYLCGNSLGLMPKRSKQRVMEELDAWGKRGVQGHWNHPYNRPWATADEDVKDQLARMVGAKPVEVSAMNTLTSNIHSMLTTFYRPTKERFKILIEEKAFPSDHYAVSSHLESREIDPKVGLLTVGPKEGECTLRTDDIIELIRGDKEIAVIMLSGIQYYSGQFFEIEKITKAGHEAGCIVGWDLAHAAGNLPLKLHDWEVDFACWCSYKYLNSGAGGIAGIFIHEKYKNDRSRPRLAGWWGNDKTNRFEMIPEFRPSEGASGYQVSNPSFLTTNSLLGSLEVFEEAGGIEELRKKSIVITGYLERLLKVELKDAFDKDIIRILTPSDPAQRGAQLSLEFPEQMMDVFNSLIDAGVIVDDRKPTVIRIAPAPLYNSFKDVYNCVQCLKSIIQKVY